ncbi:hypothetical protein RhiXN_08769 [Rhizoctonia solani]|uniref:Uncharacterized protein n=1 Tax=Rhizoctonia solani TaxID=456999 RepID=A0A8H8P315_9AGAM|nr:uncharacterized protein RhiXN_08769 [Rhizoctonia solani]QRW23733.1 hypothetical protein RhiXN_08769 [Rhizoctonia solani]
MTSFVCDQQSNWRKSNCRQSPASEGELLDPEQAIGHLASKNRARILSAFDFTIDGAPASIEPLLQKQRFQGLKVTGAVSSLLGQEGIYAQGLWYNNKGRFDWVWAHIDNVLKLEVRHDTRFQGGAQCIWMTTHVGEYAMGFPHKSYTKFWNTALAYFGAPSIGPLLQDDYRPDWWPAQSSGLWPGLLRPGEEQCVLTWEEELRQMTERLSVEAGAKTIDLGCSSAHGSSGQLGQPAHNLRQLRPWNLAFDGGIKAKRKEPYDEVTSTDPNTSSGSKGRKRKLTGRARA